MLSSAKCLLILMVEPRTELWHIFNRTFECKHHKRDHRLQSTGIQVPQGTVSNNDKTHAPYLIRMSRKKSSTVMEQLVGLSFTQANTAV